MILSSEVFGGGIQWTGVIQTRWWVVRLSWSGCGSEEGCQKWESVCHSPFLSTGLHMGVFVPRSFWLRYELFHMGILTVRHCVSGLYEKLTDYYRTTKRPSEARSRFQVKRLQMLSMCLSVYLTITAKHSDRSSLFIASMFLCLGRAIDVCGFLSFIP